MLQLQCHQFNLRNSISRETHFPSISHHSTTTKLSNLSPVTRPLNFPLIFSTTQKNTTTISVSAAHKPLQSRSHSQVNEEEENNFWGAVTLIIGTAVGPGMLGLPSATIKAGPFPSTIAILLSWVYVISSILLIAEISFASMQQDGIGEVSFTGLATTAFGRRTGAFVALVYASLSFALIVACVSGIGSIISQWFPLMGNFTAHAFFPCIVWALLGFSPFKVIDFGNRLLCFLMLFSITALVAIGVSVGRAKLLTSFAYASWAPYSILPAIPVTVLTLGFHVITPFVCKIVGKSVYDARNAVLFGGVVPLVMVLSWNLVILGLAGTTTSPPQSPISLLLSVNKSALPAVQGFAFAALATSLIGYAVSFPKQLLDTLELIGKEMSLKQQKGSPLITTNKFKIGRVGFAIFSSGDNLGTPGQVSYLGPRSNLDSRASGVSSGGSSKSVHIFVMAVVLGAPILVASFFPATFAKALDFAGVYANCFLFGILPPAMAWIYRSKRKLRSQACKDVNLLPGGDIPLLLLFGIAVALAIWH